MEPAANDRARVAALLGREPRGRFEVAVRDDAGDPVVIENAPFLDDGTPMPTRYWLVGAEATRAVARLEGEGGVAAATAAVDAQALAAAHERYAAERDALVPADRAGPRPEGGVGGTRTGVKCLHAHYAWFLAGGDDPVGRWVDDQLHRRLDVIVEPTALVLTHLGRDARVPVGPETLLAAELRWIDPPAPADLTNALGTVADHLDDVMRAWPTLIDVVDVRLRGESVWHLLTVERGAPSTEGTATLRRDDAEDVFRTLATEARADRRHNPGLEPDRVDEVVASACVVVALVRKLGLDGVEVMRP